MLAELIGGYKNGHGLGDHRATAFSFEAHKDFVSHEEAKRGYFDRKGRYDHMRLPVNNGRPLMTPMPVCDEEDSDVEGFFESSRSYHTTVVPRHQQPPHMNFVAPPHHNGKMGNGWQGKHEDAYHGEHKKPHHGGQEMQHHGGHEMQHHGGHEMQHHGGYEKQHYGGHEMQHHGGLGMQHHGGLGMQHHDRLMAPQVPPSRPMYMNPIHGSGGGRVVVKTSENWQATNTGGVPHKVGWGRKGL